MLTSRHVHAGDAGSHPVMLTPTLCLYDSYEESQFGCSLPSNSGLGASFGLRSIRVVVSCSVLRNRAFFITKKRQDPHRTNLHGRLFGHVHPKAVLTAAIVVGATIQCRTQHTKRSCGSFQQSTTRYNSDRYR